MSERISLRQISRESGFGLATVSMALRGDIRVATETRTAILNIAQGMGYQPDPVLSALAQQRWHAPENFGGYVLALVYNSPVSMHAPPGGFSPLKFPIYQERGIAPSANKRGYKVESFNLHDYPNGRALGRVLHQRGIKGLLLAPQYMPMKDPPIDWNLFSVVSLGVGYYPYPFHTVDINYHDQIMLALEKIIAHGYRRIGVVLIRHDHPLVDDESREGACHVAQAKWSQSGIKIKLLLHTHTQDSDEFQATYCQWWRKWKPDCILGFNQGFLDRLTIGPKLRCPEDFAFASLHLEDDSKNHAGIIRNDAVRGSYGVYLLDLLLRGNETGIPPHPILHHAGFEWRDGDTLRPRTSGQ